MVFTTKRGGKHCQRDLERSNNLQEDRVQRFQGTGPTRPIKEGEASNTLAKGRTDNDQIGEPTRDGGRKTFRCRDD